MTDTLELEVMSFGIAFGVVYGVLLLLIGWAAWLTGFGTEYVSLAATLLPGFGASPVGGIIGGVAGFVLGGVMGAAIACIYNLFAT